MFAQSTTMMAFRPPGNNSIRVAWTWARNQALSIFTGFGYNRVQDDHSREENEMHEIDNNNITRDFSNTAEDNVLISNNHSDHDNDNEDDDTSSEGDSNNDTTTKSPTHRWIKGVYLCARVSAVVLLINVILVIVAAGLSGKNAANAGFSSTEVVFKGSCTVSKGWDAALHLIINIFSTIILAASNYCMQSLVAPSREEVDKAHAQRKWLDIGVPSARNLFVIGRYRVLLWCLLLVTATPFHLLYNSAVFGSLATNEYSVVLAPSDLDLQDVLNLTTPGLEDCFAASAGLSWSEFASDLSHGNYEKLSRQQCVDLSNVQFPSGTRTLVALSDNLTMSQGGDLSILDVGYGGKPSRAQFGALIHPTDMYGYQFANTTWAFALPSRDGTVIYQPYNFTIQACADDTSTGNDSTLCADAEKLANWLSQTQPQAIELVNNYIHANLTTSNITAHVNSVSCGFNDYSVYQSEECLVIKAEERCQLLYNPPICLAILGTAIVKVMAMFLAARLDRDRSEPLRTVGDAVVSFLTRPDPTTAGKCWMSKSDVRDSAWKKPNVRLTGRDPKTASHEDCPELFITRRRLSRRKFWMQATSFQRWVVTLILCGTCLGVGAYLLEQADNGVGGDNSSVRVRYWWQLGFGTANPSIIDTNLLGLPIIAYVVIANSPQFIVTISYYFYNNVLTSMLAAAEYSSYGVKPKPLRVSWPKKDSCQRSTYWLSVPYRYSIPLLVTYMALHWLISQSIFYVQILPYNLQQQPLDDFKVSALGYSPIAIFFSLIVGGIMVSALLGLGFFRRFQSEMPLAGSCSAAISAACHLPIDDDTETAALGAVMWGETVSPPVWMVDPGGIGEGDIGHCSFTSKEVVRPSRKKLYA